MLLDVVERVDAGIFAHGEDQTIPGRKYADGAQRNFFLIKAAAEISHRRKTGRVAKAEVAFLFADEERWPSKVTAARLSAGDTLQITVPNSAGYGDPLERDPELVLSDVLDGYTTLELAGRDYGVVIDGETLTVDREATTRLRKERIAVPLA